VTLCAEEQAPAAEVSRNVDRLVELIRMRELTRPASGQDHGLFVCDVKTGETTLVSHEPRDGYTHCGSACWSRDGRRIVYDVSPGRDYAKTHIHTIDLANKNAEPDDLGAGNCPGISPDGKTLAFLLNAGAVPDATAGVWLMNADGSNRRRVGGFGRPRWSPDGKQLLINSFSNPRRLELRDIETEEQRDIEVPGHLIRSDVVWAGDMHTLIAVVEADSKRRIVALDISDPEKTKIKQVLWQASDGVAPSFPDYWPETKLCVFIGRNQHGAALYSFTAGHDGPPKRVERSGHDRGLFGPRFSPDGRYVLFSSDRVHPRVILAGPIAATTTWQVAGENQARFAVLSDDNTELFTGGTTKAINVWDTRTGKPLRKIDGHGGSSICAAISPDGKLLATGSYSKTVYLWDTKSGERVADLDTGEMTTISLDFSPDGEWLAVGSRSGKVLVLNPQLLEKLWESPAPSLPITQVAFSPDGKTLATTSGHWRRPNQRGEVKLWSADDGEELASLEAHTGAISCVEFSHDGKLLATGDGRARLIIWEVKTRKILTSINTPNGVQGVGLLHDGKTVAAAIYLGGVWLWDIKSGQPVVQYEGHADTKSVFDLSLSEDGSLIATVGSNGDVKIWPTKLD
jgi:WD40 repeat protein